MVVGPVVSAAEPITIVEPDGRIIHMNEGARQLLDLHSDEGGLGESIFTHLPSAEHESLREQFTRIDSRNAPAMGLALNIEAPLRDTSRFVVLNTAIEWEGEDRIKMLFFDIDDYFPPSLATRTMDETPLGISIADAARDDLPLIYVNDGFCDLTGYSREEILGRNCRFLQGEETSEKTVTEIRDALETAHPLTVELRNYRKDGSMFWNQLSLTPIQDDDGTVTHFLGFQKDITQRKVFEQEKTLFEKQADVSEQAVVVTDAEGTIEYVNPAFERMTGYSAEEAIGESPRILKSDQQDEAFFRELWETITAGEVWEATLTNRRKSGELFQTQQKIVPITDRDGEITNFVAIEEDITEEQFIEQMLHVMDRVMRHNLRNSVSAISSFAELLEDELDDTAHKTAVQTIQSHAQKLGRLSDKTRTLRELFENREGQRSLPVEAIGGFIETMRTNYPDATIDLSMEADPGLVVENGVLLQLAIEEALENAVVHNDQNTPHIEISVRQLVSDGELQIAVADDGPGIPDDQWEVIMAGEETPLVHVTGIGLWLMYWTVTALGGTMERATNDPRGTVLTYRIPLKMGEHVADWNPDV